MLVNGWLSGVDAPFVSNDDVASMDLAVNHLVQLGHTEIGLALGPERYTPVIRKVQGFRAAMREHLGVEPAHLERLVTHTVFSLEGGAAAAGRLISRGATAVICGSDLMALGAIRQARSMGLSVPRDVSVVGLRRLHDHGVHRPAADHDPPVACEAMGDAAVRALLDEIGGEGPPAGGVRLPARARRARLDRRGAAPRLSRRRLGCRWPASEVTERHGIGAVPLARRGRHPYGSGMRISDVIRRKGGDVITVRTDASVTELLSLLSEHKIGAVVVSDDGESVHGIVSERDIVRHLHTDGAALLDAPVGQIMTAEVHTASPDESLDALESMMTERRFRHVPVVVDGKLVAIVSIGDVVKNRIDDLQAERDQLRDYIQS